MSNLQMVIAIYRLKHVPHATKGRIESLNQGLTAVFRPLFFVVAAPAAEATDQYVETDVVPVRVMAYHMAVQQSFIPPFHYRYMPSVGG